MSEKHVVVIGAGIAGLSAASYLLRNGYRVTIVEQHTAPGGLCTSWNRNGYTIDYCVHWLMGSKAGTAMHSIWEELGAFNNKDGSRVPIVHFDEFSTIGLSDGSSICLYSDLEALKKELLRVGPEDKKEIEKLCITLKQLGALTNNVRSSHVSFTEYLANGCLLVGQMIAMMRQLIPMGTYVQRFKNPSIREMLLAEIPSDWSLIAFTMGLAQQHVKAAGYTIGGSLNMAMNIARVVEQLGGIFRYGTAVKTIRIRESSATGVVLSDDTEIDADFVISAADGHQTLYSMLEGKFIPRKFQKAFTDYPLFPSTIHIALGMDRNCSDIPHGFTPYFPDPIQLADGTIVDRCLVNAYHYDPTLAPEGKTLLTVLINTWEGLFWSRMANERPHEYTTEKKRIAEEVIGRLEHILGNFSQHVEMIDVSTPHSVIRYTGNWQGSFEGFAPTNVTLKTRLPKIIPNLHNFAMIGQWTAPGGGLPTAAKDGRDIAKHMCKSDGKVWTAVLR